MADRFLDAVRHEVAKYTGAEPGEIQPDDRFEDLGIDSLDAVGIIADLEDEFEVEVPDADLRGIRTVGDAVAVVRRAAGESEGAQAPAGP